MLVRSIVLIALITHCLLLSTVRAGELPGDSLTFRTYKDCDARTKSLVDEVTASVGGFTALARISSLHRVAVTEESAPGGIVRVGYDGTAVLPDSFSTRITSSGRTLVAVVTPEDAFVFGHNATVANAALRLDERETLNVLQYFYSTPHIVLRNRGRSDVSFAHAGERTIGARPAEVLAANVAGREIRWYFDTAGRRVVGASLDGELAELDDWRTIDGVSLPFIERRFVDGRIATVVRTRSYVTNAAFDDQTLFPRPSTWLKRIAYTHGAGGTARTPTSSRSSASRDSKRGSQIAIDASSWSVYSTPLGPVFVEFFREMH